ncbi:MAG TPA: hypothetical protein VFV90_00760 [Usitatibacter sp.]|nr:hypothetical protein [Usitatibacter sp.]
MAKRGRKQQYPDSTFVAILRRYAKGEDLMRILKADGMPDWSTFWDRVMGPSADPELTAAHARARDSWAEAKVAEAMEITDRPQLGKKVRKGPDGTTTTTGDMVDARRLRVSTRLWFAERVLSKSYGAAVRATHQNPDGTPMNVVPVINVTVLAEGKS